MAILYGYFDESGKHKDHPVVAFSGVCAMQSKLPAFEQAWKEILRYYGMKSLHMAKAGRLSEKICDKMPRGQTAEARTAALKPFADCINEHLELGFIQAWDVEGFNSLSKKARYPLGNVADPFYIAFVRGLAEIIDYVHGDDRVALICDDDLATAWDCYKYYRGVKAADPAVREKVVSLGFANDDHFVTLQAADMVAYLSRLEAKRRFYGTPYTFPELFRYVTTERGVNQMSWRALFADKPLIKKLGSSLECSKQKKRKI